METNQYHTATKNSNAPNPLAFSINSAIITMSVWAFNTEKRWGIMESTHAMETLEGEWQ